MIPFRRLHLLALLGLVSILISCKKEIAPGQVDGLPVTVSSLSANASLKQHTHYGPAIPMGKGVGRAWVTTDAEGTPVALGVNVAAKAVLNQGDEGTNYLFQLPGQVAVPPFNHIEMGWNPHGHEPAGVYTVPHFDLHFYMISSAYQSTIPFLAPPAMDLAPAAKYIPPAYIQTPGLIPNMGAHWADVLSSEFHPGGQFTKTFIIGTYSGNVTFMEPMITLSYFNGLTSGTSSVTTPIRQPQAFQRAGYYPASYTISYGATPEEFSVSLNNLAYHQAN